VDDDDPADFTTIQAAIDAAVDGDTVIVQPGAYTGAGNRDISFKGKAITVRGTDPNDWDVVRRTIIDCQGTQSEPHRGFLFATGEGPNSVLSGVTITGGCAPDIALDIYKRLIGGGICCSQSSPSIIRCRIIGNFAQSGGGGVFAYNGNPTICQCEFLSNVNSSVGAGAIEVWGGGAVIAHCLVANNYGDYCGGVSCRSTSAFWMENCLIRHNEGRYESAGVRIESVANATILHCTITENHIEEGRYGAGLCVVNNPKMVWLKNCILSGNSCRGTRDKETQIYWSGDRYADYCCIEGWDGKWAGVGSFGTDPLLTRDARLRPDSPCIDAGDPDVGDAQTMRDVDGEARLSGARVDIGCDEFVDADGDDLADSWERRHFSDLTAATGAGNPDGDSWDNASEYVRDSNPLHRATAYFVDPVCGNDGWDGLSASWDGSHGPKATIRAALDRVEAHDMDQIVLMPGLYSGQGNRNIDFDGKEVTIRSVDTNNPAVVAATIIDCNGMHPVTGSTRGGSASTEPRRAFVLRSGEETEAGIEGLTIINGAAATAGGAILCEWSSPHIVNCTFRNNESADRGGAIYCRNGSTTLEQCTLEQNQATDGGAIACASVDGHTIATNCVVRANTALSSGGGLLCGSGTQVVGCLIAANEAQGQDDSWGGSRELSGGGGVLLRGDGIVLANCTISGNIATQGSALASGCISDIQAWAALYNCIVWDNSGAEENQIMFSRCCQGCVRTSGPVGLCVHQSCIGATPTPSADSYASFIYIEDANCSHVDPCFVSPGNGDYRLQADSPCIDAGYVDLPVSLPLVDLGSTNRLVDFDGDGVAQVDLGAYESHPPQDVYLIPSCRSVRFHVYDTSPVAPSQTMVVRNTGSNSLRWIADCNCSWLEISPTSGETRVQITLRGNGTGLLPGTYAGTLVIQAPSAANSPLAIPVELQVGRTLRVPEDCATIQAALDAAESGDMVVLADGTYAGPGNREIAIPPKNLWIRSEYGPQACIIDCSDADAGRYSGFTAISEGSDVICEGITFQHGEYHGFLVRNGRLRLIDCHATDFKYPCEGEGAVLAIEGCQFSGGDIGICVTACDVSIHDSGVVQNAMGMAVRSSQVVVTSTEIRQNTLCGLSIYSCFNTVFDHCLVSGNGRGSYGEQAIEFYNTLPIIRNCTIVGNASYLEGGTSTSTATDVSKAGQVVNCILWDNGHAVEKVLSQCIVSYSNIQGGWAGEGNIDVNPLFVSDGYWESVGRGPSSSWVDGDYHLKSRAGRWDAGSESWVVDDVTSPCIDAGDPNSPVGDEPQPNGGRINMGAYGGTAQASKSHWAQ
jgi:predicted outer membrane repeat protein